MIGFEDEFHREAIMDRINYKIITGEIDLNKDSLEKAIKQEIKEAAEFEKEMDCK